MAIALAYVDGGNVMVRKTNGVTFTIFLTSNQRLQGYNFERVYIIDGNNFITEYDETCTVKSSYFIR